MVSPADQAVGISARSDGGNNALFLKKRFALTLTDKSPQMIAVSKSINPECEHVIGDMRGLRLGRRFDAVFVHDAICYMTTLADLRRALRTAFVHCKPGGVALFAPDEYRDTFRRSTRHGGHDAATRGLRYLEVSSDPDPSDTQYDAEYVCLLRDGKLRRVVYDRHVLGLFSRDDWRKAIERAGFQMLQMTRPSGCSNVIVVRRPGRRHARV